MPLAPAMTLLTVLYALNAAPAAAEFQLGNGLDVLLLPSSAGTKTALVVLFDIGELDDPAGQSGMAHMIEHLYVTAATPSAPARSAADFFKRYDRQANAQTGREFTVVAGVFPNARLEKEITDAAARMGKLKIAAADIQRELPRLEAELANMYGGLPHLAVTNRGRRAICPLKKDAQPGGDMAQIRALSLASIRKRYHRYYRPQNARLVVAGKFQAAAVRSLVETAFGGIRRGEALPVRPNPRSPPAVEPVKVNVSRPRFGNWPRGFASIVYRVPDPGDPLYPPFLMLAMRLSESLRSVPTLSQPTVMPFQYRFLDDPHVLAVSKSLGVEESAEAAWKSLRGSIETAVDTGEARQPDLALVKRNAGPILGLEPFPPLAAAANPYGLAFSRGRLKQLGITRGKLAAALKEVSSADLKRCAAKVFGAARGAPVAVIIKD